MSDWTPKLEEEARIGRIGADRMDVGLSSIPDKERGDLESVRLLRARLDKLERALHEIAHDHGWQAVALSKGSASLAVGFAQGIAREALGEPQNGWTKEAMALREYAKENALNAMARAALADLDKPEEPT